MKHLVEKVRPVVTLAAVLCVSLICHAQSPSKFSGSDTNTEILFNQLISLDPHSATNLNRLVQIAGFWETVQKKEAKVEKKLARTSVDLKNLSTIQLQKRFVDEAPRHEARAASAIARLALEALQGKDAEARAAEILEIQTALRNETQPLVPERLGVFTTWLFFFKNISGTIARGNTIATNLAAATSGNDSGRNDPLPSTFWTRPSAISQENLYAGFGREKFPRLDESLCEYNAPKISTGTHAGFDVVSEGQRYKIKFGEANSEPFTARIFYALGYHVDPTDFTPELKIRYDRRMFREFHLRKPLTMRITPLGIPLWTVQLQKHYDPFSFITRAVFKDGREVSGAALKQMLFTNPHLSHPEDSPENFRPEIEASLDYLVMATANVQPRDGPAQSIGSWEFGGLGHEDRRELRGAGLLAAWLGWFDSRADNTKLRIGRDEDNEHLEHFISDLGGGLGAGTGLFSPKGENPNAFTWTFTQPEFIRGPGRMTTPFRIEHFKPLVPTPAFAAMTVDDARWMARLIGQLTENQLRAALIASGYDNAEARLYLEKLATRRDRMIHDLNLDAEIPPLRPNGPNHKFSYNPLIDCPFEATLNGSKIAARESSQIISGGKLLPHIHVQP